MLDLATRLAVAWMERKFFRESYVQLAAEGGELRTHPGMLSEREEQRSSRRLW